MSGCIFLATISCAASKSMREDDIWKSEEKTIVTSGGSIYASINTTTITYAALGALAAVTLFGILFYLAVSGDSVKNKSGGEYLYPESAYASTSAADATLGYAATEQNLNDPETYRRKRSAFEQSKLRTYKSLYKSNTVESYSSKIS